MPQLLIRDNTGQVTAHELAGDRITIGRSPENTVVLIDETVSNHHAEILSLGEKFLLVDLHSANGTTVNGEVAESVTLRNDDQITFGGVRASFNCIKSRSESTLDNQEKLATSGIKFAYLLRRPWLIATGALALLLLAVIALQSGLASWAYPSSKSAHLARHADQTRAAQTSSKGGVSSLLESRQTPYLQSAKEPSLKKVQPVQLKELTLQEKDDIHDAINTFTECASRSRTCPADCITWDESNGTLEFINQPPIASPQHFLYKLLVGDLDPTKTRVVAEPKYHAYSVAFYNPEDTRFISIVTSQSGKKDVTSSGDFVFFMFDDLPDAQKTARAINFLSETYARKGFRTALSVLSNEEVFRLIIKKSNPNNDVKFEADKLVVMLRLFSEEITTKSVRFEDLDPERFTYSTSDERLFYVKFGCRSKQPLINVSSSNGGYRQPETSLDLVTRNERDKDRLLKIITNLCTEHGWRPSKF